MAGAVPPLLEGAPGVGVAGRDVLADEGRRPAGRVVARVAHALGEVRPVRPRVVEVVPLAHDLRVVPGALVQGEVVHDRRLAVHGAVLVHVHQELRLDVVELAERLSLAPDFVLDRYRAGPEAQRGHHHPPPHDGGV